LDELLVTRGMGYVMERRLRLRFQIGVADHLMVANVEVWRIEGQVEIDA